MYQLYYDSPVTLEVAATTKLVRNIFMGLVIPILAVSYHRKHRVVQSSKVTVPWLKWSQWVPPFLIGFLVLAIIRSIGDLGGLPFGFLSPESKLVVLGWKPLFIGCSAALIVGVVSYVLVALLY